MTIESLMGCCLAPNERIDVVVTEDTLTLMGISEEWTDEFREKREGVQSFIPSRLRKVLGHGKDKV